MNDDFNEKDWKLFRKKLPGWQEACMDRLNRQYREILSQEEKDPSEIFWELKDRIEQDKDLTGVTAYRVSRSNMYHLLVCLLSEGTITPEDLLDFSEELQEGLRWVVKADDMESEYAIPGKTEKPEKKWIK